MRPYQVCYQMSRIPEPSSGGQPEINNLDDEPNFSTYADMEMADILANPILFQVDHFSLERSIRDVPRGRCG